MIYSEVTNHVQMTYNVTMYAYDALGRRTVTQSVTGETLRTLYDGRSFEVIREGETFRSGSLTTQFSGSAARADASNGNAAGERYRWIGDGGSSRLVTEEGYTAEDSRYGYRGVTLYARGEAVAVSYSSSTASRSVYLGKDVLGSVRSTTTDSGNIEDRYEYDAFGTPYKGDLSGVMNLGYTGKPYDVSTGFYNYGYRDYKPQAARFTTVDPIRDGSNWFSYVNGDPVNYIDLWGLSDREVHTNSSTIIRVVNPARNGENLGFFNLFSATVTTNVITTSGSNTIDVFSYTTKISTRINGTTADTIAFLYVNGFLVDSARLEHRPTINSDTNESLGYATLTLPADMAGDISVKTATAWIIPHTTGMSVINQYVTVKINNCSIY